MAKIQLYTESKTIKLTKQQVNSLNVLKSYNVDVSRFIKRSVKPIGQLCCRWGVVHTVLVDGFNSNPSCRPWIAITYSTIIPVFC